MKKNRLARQYRSGSKNKKALTIGVLIVAILAGAGVAAGLGVLQNRLESAGVEQGQGEDSDKGSKEQGTGTDTGKDEDDGGADEQGGQGTQAQPVIKQYDDYGVKAENDQLLDDLNEEDKAKLVQGLALWGKQAGIDTSDAKVVSEAIGDQSHNEAVFSVAGRFVTVSWDGQWTISADGQTVTIQQPDDSGADSAMPAPASLDDAAALDKVLGSGAGEPVKDAWQSWASGAGVDSAGATVDPSSVKMMGQLNEVNFIITAADGTTYPASWTIGGVCAILPQQ